MMLRFKSLTAKFVFLGMAMLAFFAVFAYASFVFTQHIEGEGRRMNIAGRQRMLTLSMSYGIMSSLSFLPSHDRERYIKNARYRMAEYEEALYGIRDGSERLLLKPMPWHDKESIAQASALIVLWENTQRPTLITIMGLPVERKNETCVKCHSTVRDNLPKIEALVKSIQTHYDKAIKDFDVFRYYAFGFFVIFAAFGILYLRRSIIVPVRKLKDATAEVEKGNFDVRAEIITSDEIGDLSGSFNQMSKTIGVLFAEKSRLLKDVSHKKDELDILNRLSSKVSQSLSAQDIANIALDEILNLENLSIEKKGAIFLLDEKKDILNLIAQRGFSEEFARLEANIPMGECLCGIAAKTGEPVISDDCHKDERHTRRYPEMIAHGHINLPLKSRGKTIGVLCLYLPPHIRISDEEADIYKAIGDIIAVSLQNAINHRQVAMLAQSLESSIDLIVITDMEGKIIHANPQVMEHLGYTQDEIIGKDVSSIQSPRNPQGLGREIYEKTLEGGWAGEVINIREDGSEYPVLLTTSPVKDEDGGIVALIGTARDITERKRLEEQLEKYAGDLEEQVKERTKELEVAKLQAEAANRAKSDFLANMSHELRTPLNSIIGFSKVIMGGMAGPLNEQQKDYLNDVVESGNHLLSLINDILDLSKVEAGKMELEPTEFNLGELIDGSLVMFREKAMKHGIKLKAEVDAGIENIVADERKIKQVLFNLLSNAMKFTPDGGEVGVEATMAGEEIRIAVRDTGIGISEEDMPRLFQPFQQLDSTLTKEFAGTGLGLNLCKKFVELHGGRIRVESEPGKGSRFMFEMPVKR